MLETTPLSLKHFLAGGVVLLSFGLMFEQLGGRLPPIAHGATQPTSASPVCTKVVKPKSSISRKELANLLAIPEGKSRATVRGIVAEPYCKMPNLEVRAGTTSEREVYPLEFNPRTWLVVLYEGESYAGYDFVVR